MFQFSEADVYDNKHLRAGKATEETVDGMAGVDPTGLVYLHCMMESQVNWVCSPTYSTSVVNV